MALLDRILGDPARTRRAVCLMVAGAVAVAVMVAPVLLIVSKFGLTGAAAVGGLGALTTAGIAARRTGISAGRKRSPRS